MSSGWSFKCDRCGVQTDPDGSTVATGYHPLSFPFPPAKWVSYQEAMGDPGAASDLGGVLCPACADNFKHWLTSLDPVPA